MNPPDKKQFYIGSRSSNRLPEDDPYMSSSSDSDFKKRIKLFPNDFKKIILGTYKTRKEANESEISFHKINRVSENPLFYNKAEASATGTFLKGYVVVKDKTGKTFSVENTNPDYLSGELVSVICGTITVRNKETLKYEKIHLKEYYSNKEKYETLIESKSKNFVSCVDENGTNYSISKEEYINGHHRSVNSGMKVCRYKNKNIRVPKTSTLDHISKGTVKVKDVLGNYYSVSIDDPKYLSGELQHNTRGKTVVRDSNGNTLQINVDDPRILSGELKGIASRKCVAYDIDENRIQVSTDDRRWRENELVGHRSKYAIISNGSIKKIIKQSVLENFKDWTVLKLRE